MSDTQTPPPLRGTKWLVIAATVVAIPMTLALESVLRDAFMPRDFDEVRLFLRPEMNVVAWTAATMTFVLGVTGLAMFERLASRATMRLPEDRGTATRIAGARIGVFALVASIAQVPGLFSTVALMLGADWLPVIVGVLVSTAVVVAQGLRC